RPPVDDAPFCGLVFKIQADTHDELAFVRVYSGTLKPSSRMLNATRDIKENVTRLWQLQAKDREKVDMAVAGDIVGVVGLKGSYTGDTLCDPKAPLILEKIVFPKTVISQSIEPEFSADKQKLIDTLRLMQKEDPTFTAAVSEETGQTIINGMGELHLSVVVEKMTREYKLKMRVSKPRVSYRETIHDTIRIDGECARQGAAGAMFAKVSIELTPFRLLADGGKSEPVAEAAAAAPTKGGKGAKSAKASEGKAPATPVVAEPFRFVNHCPVEALPPEMLAIVQAELREQCLAGGLLGFPLIDIQATLVGAEFRPGESNEQAYRFAVATAVQQGLNQAGSDVLEPIMKLDVTTPEEFMGDVISDLGTRRAEIQETGFRGLLRIVTARVPLREMFGYLTSLRNLSQGRANYSMEPLEYAVAPPEVAAAMM
ncbi:MAG: EF-Tu/IF-2/RF-3 family GTPase, partial [Planctomycetia bacterium]